MQMLAARNRARHVADHRAVAQHLVVFHESMTRDLVAEFDCFDERDALAFDVQLRARVDPRRILNAVRHYQVTNLFGSPALLRRVAFSPEAAGVTLRSLRRVISAGAPVPAAVIARVTGLLEQGVQVHTPYGATEALPVSSIGSDELLGETAAATTQGKGVCQDFTHLMIALLRNDIQLAVDYYATMKAGIEDGAG